MSGFNSGYRTMSLDHKNKNFFLTVLMHQSIPAAPIPPRATAGHLRTLSVPGVGH